MLLEIFGLIFFAFNLVVLLIVVPDILEPVLRKLDRIVRRFLHRITR